MPDDEVKKMEDIVEENQTPVAAPAPTVQLPSAFSLFKPSFSALMLNIWTFLGLFLVPMAGLLLTVPLTVMARGQSSVNIFVIIVGITSIIFFFFTAAALPYVQLKSARGEQVGMAEALRAGLKHFWRFYGLSILVGILVTIGFICLIVPGLFALQRFYLAAFYVYDQNMGIIAAMKKSAADAKRFSGSVWGVIGVKFVLGLPSVVPLLALVAIALQLAYTCAPALRYLQIKALTDNPQIKAS